MFKLGAPDWDSHGAVNRSGAGMLSFVIFLGAHESGCGLFIVTKYQLRLEHSLQPPDHFQTLDPSIVVAGQPTVRM